MDRIGIISGGGELPINIGKSLLKKLSNMFFILKVIAIKLNMVIMKM